MDKNREGPVNSAWAHKATLLAIQDSLPEESRPCVSPLEAVYLQEIQQARPYHASFQDMATPSTGHRYSLVLIRLSTLTRDLELEWRIPDDLMIIRIPLLPTLPPT